MLVRGTFLAVLATVLTVSLSTAAEPPQQSKPTSVLWVGNSFTYYNDGIPDAVQRLVAELSPSLVTGKAPRFVMSAIGGAHLVDHASQSRARIGHAKLPWDLVMLQGYSDEPVNPAKSASFQFYGKVLAKVAHRTGAKVALFMIWAYNDRPEMTKTLASAYQAMAAEINAQVVPVGLAFAQARAARPSLALYVDKDTKHPSPAGTYLAACTFFAALYGISPE